MTAEKQQIPSERKRERGEKPKQTRRERDTWRKLTPCAQ